MTLVNNTYTSADLEPCNDGTNESHCIGGVYPSGWSAGTLAPNTAPVITLTNPSSNSYTVGGTYVEHGATAVDAEDGAIAVGAPSFSPALDMATAGTYVATYSVTDSGGLTGTATRNVVVSVAGVVTEGSVTANAFFNWDVESAPLGPLNNATSGVPFDELDIYPQGPCHISAGPSGIGSRSGTRCIRIDMDADEDGAFFYIGPESFPDTADIQTIYVRWWEYYEGFAGNWPVGLKIARFFSGPDNDAASLSYPYCSAKLWNSYGGDPNDTLCRGINHAIYNDDREHTFAPTDLFGDGQPYIKEGRWYKHEMQLTLNSDYTGDGSADGIMRHWIDDVMFYEETDLIFGSVNKGNGSYANGWNRMYFGGNYSGATFGDPSETIYRYIDDMYVSTTVDR